MTGFNKRLKPGFAMWLAIVLAFVFGLLDLAGWVLGIDLFKSILPGGPKMVPATAICFLLIGLGLKVSGKNSPILSTLQHVAILIVFVLALQRFLEYSFNWDPGINLWAGVRLGSPVGRGFTGMSINTAVLFLLSVLGIMLMRGARRWQRRPAMLALIGIVIGALAAGSLISYGVHHFPGRGMPGMAVQAAAVFIVIGLAILAHAWQQSGETWHLSKTLTAGFVLSGTIILSLNMLAYRISTQQIEENLRLDDQLRKQSRLSGDWNSLKVRDRLSHERATEVRDVLFTGILLGLGLLAGGLWVLNRSVAERRQVEVAMRKIEQKAGHALRESEERFRQMAENIECVFWMRDDNLEEFLYVSPACRQVWGRSPNALYAYGHEFITAVHPEDRDRVSAQLRLKQFIQKAGFQMEYRVLCPDGSVRWVSDRAFPIGDEYGQLRRLVGIAEDITERKEAEEALRITQERFRSVWERSADGMRITDRDGRVLAVNEAYCRLVKRSRQELEGHPFSVVYRGHGPTDGIDAYQSKFETEDIVPLLSARVQLWNSEELELEISNSFVQFGQTSRALLSIFRDVGERKALEEQLRQAQKMEAVGRLAGGVAHDFNNLLVVMRTHAELLLLDEVGQTIEAREGLQQITNAADRAANLTRQLLAFSRKQVMQSQPLLLNNVLSTLNKMLNRIIGEDIRLECRYAGGLPLVQADAGMLDQVMINLAVNARDAMPDGGTLQVATEKVVLDDSYPRANPEGRPGEFVCLSVTDTGTGIAPEHLPRIFEPFFTTKDLGKGTGLGLATVYGIVKQHQGWIEVNSRLGTGTTFKVFLPSLGKTADQAATPIASVHARGGHETILLVEDDFCVRLAIKESLQKYGYKIYEAACAREALNAWERYESEIDLLLTDIVMPEGVNGRQLAEKIRAEKPNLCVIFMSGYSADMAGKDTGFFRRNNTAFLQKPFPATTLLETVRRCVDRDCEILSC